MRSVIKRSFYTALILAAAGCFTDSGTRYIRIQGSDTMKILVDRWAEEYMKSHPLVSIYVSGGGSLQGIEALIDGNIDICATSRLPLPPEVRMMAESHNKLGVSILVAKDALSIYVNPQNPVRNLSLDDVKRIFTGEIRNWKAAGGEDHPITIIGRPPNSGTYSYLKEYVLDEEPYFSGTQIRVTTRDVIRAVLEDRFAIGYGGTAYGEHVTHLRIEAVGPTIQNVISDRYPISRYLYFYTVDTPRGVIDDFINWTLTETGQAIVAKTGFIPLFE